MARESNLYIDFWESYSDYFIGKILEGGTTDDPIIDCKKLASLGDRQDYTFRIQYENAIAVNNLEGSAVARNLDTVLTSNRTFKIIAKRKSIYIRLKSNYTLDIFVKKLV